MSLHGYETAPVVGFVHYDQNGAISDVSCAHHHPYFQQLVQGSHKLRADLLTELSSSLPSNESSLILREMLKAKNSGWTDGKPTQPDRSMRTILAEGLNRRDWDGSRDRLVQIADTYDQLHTALCEFPALLQVFRGLEALEGQILATIDTAGGLSTLVDSYGIQQRAFRSARANFRTDSASRGAWRPETEETVGEELRAILNAKHIGVHPCTSTLSSFLDAHNPRSMAGLCNGEPVLQAEVKESRTKRTAILKALRPLATQWDKLASTLPLSANVPGWRANMRIQRVEGLELGNEDLPR